jgi:hypothetical protein
MMFAIGTPKDRRNSSNITGWTKSSNGSNITGSIGSATASVARRLYAWGAGRHRSISKGAKGLQTLARIGGRRLQR